MPQSVNRPIAALLCFGTELIDTDLMYLHENDGACYYPEVGSKDINKCRYEGRNFMPLLVFNYARHLVTTVYLFYVG